MTDIRFGRLKDLPLRDAWKNEAKQFTPWLSENIEHLSEAIGIPLELTGTEVAVERFSADILARNAEDGSKVLIENQLETTDHTHLGQIMTYLAGLEAHTVVWIAPDFREPHLTAIRWLNEHTSDDFSFLAVRLRVVQIGDSPFAPIFEIAAKPDQFERTIRRKVEAEGAAYYDIKEEFWTAFLAAHPEFKAIGFKVSRYSANYTRIHEDPNIEIAVWIGRKECGVYLRSAWGEPFEPAQKVLKPYSTRLESALGVPLGPTGRDNHFFSKRTSLGHDDRSAWSSMMAWLTTELETYKNALNSALKGEA